MSKADVKADNFQVTQLSLFDSQSPSWAIAVFAHNEEKNIAKALGSVAAAITEANAVVYVLANGCADGTVAEVRKHAHQISNLYLVEMAIADKASAWNVFIHDVLTADQLHQVDTCFLMDGDVTVNPDTFALLDDALHEKPQAEAAGAMPATGRNRDAWRQRMSKYGMLAGNCYALRKRFVKHLRERRIRMPRGHIGEDFFVSWLVASNAWRNDFLENEGLRCVFHSGAEFSFRSLSPWHLSAYRTYFLRKWRYTLREIQHQMLILLIHRRGIAALPLDVEQLYRIAPLPSRFLWCGVDTPMRTIAVQWIRRKRNTRVIPEIS